jgi:acyl carrier protein
MRGSPAERAEVRRTIEGIWRELLEIDELPSEAFFLELGGNSFQASVFVGRLQEELGIEIDVEQVFELSLAELVRIASAVASRSDHVGEPGNVRLS